MDAKEPTRLTKDEWLSLEFELLRDFQSRTRAWKTLEDLAEKVAYYDALAGITWRTEGLRTIGR